MQIALEAKGAHPAVVALAMMGSWPYRAAHAIGRNAVFETMLPVEAMLAGRLSSACAPQHRAREDNTVFDPKSMQERVAPRLLVIGAVVQMPTLRLPSRADSLPCFGLPQLSFPITAIPRLPLQRKHPYTW